MTNENRDSVNHEDLPEIGWEEIMFRVRIIVVGLLGLVLMLITMNMVMREEQYGSNPAFRFKCACMEASSCSCLTRVDEL